MMRALKNALRAFTPLLVISIACVPVAEAPAHASNSVSLSRPNSLVGPQDVLQRSPRIGWRNEVLSPSEPHGGGDFYFLPYVEPEWSDEALQGIGTSC